MTMISKLECAFISIFIGVSTLTITHSFTTSPSFTIQNYSTSNSPYKSYSRTSLFVNRNTPKFDIQENDITKPILRDDTDFITNTRKCMSAFALSVALVAASSTTMLPEQQNAYAYDSTDYASETVTETLQSLKDSIGDKDATFKTFENIAAIITEGKGVGGSLSYTGVQLERGYVADEDTTIYNPGLTLLTESEKERLVEAVIQNRKGNMQQNTWSSDNQFAFEFLKQKLDPLHITELRGYLSILPFYGAGLYMIALAVQQFARDLFPVAYIVSALAIFLPIIVLVAKGP